MPLQPVRIQVVYLKRGDAVQGPIPVCADMQSGIYFRSQSRGQQLLVGSVREEDERETVSDPDAFSTQADDDFKREKLHLLQHRLSGLRLDGSIRDYCGLYTVNLADVHPLLGALGPEGHFVANGFSGHGFKAAPAVGAIMARKISGITLPGEDPSDDDWLSPLRAPLDLTARSVLA
jgi:glycine/D-amino acid oxidase-like deaminating enzyme